MIKPIEELNSLWTHENQLYKENMRIIDEINSLNTYDDLIQFLDKYKKYWDNMNEKLFMVFFHRISEYFTDLNKSSKQIIFSKVFWIDYEKKLDEETKNLVKEFIEAEYIWKNIINIFRNWQILKEVEVNKNYPLEAYQNSFKTVIDWIHNCWELWNSNLEIEKIESFDDLINFVKIFEWEEKIKLDIKYFTQFIVKLKKDFKSLSQFSRSVICIKVFWMNFYNNISEDQKNTLSKYLEHDILKPEYTIFSPEGELLEKPILKNEDLIFNEDQVQIDFEEELNKINTLKELLEFSEEIKKSNIKIINSFDLLLSKLKELKSEIVNEEYVLLLYRNILWDNYWEKLSDTQNYKLFEFTTSLETIWEDL